MPARYHFADFFQQNFMQPWSTVVDAALGVVNDEANPLRDTPLGRWQAASLESTSRLLGQYPKRAFGLDETVVAGKPVAVTERVVLEKPFCRLLNLAKSTRRRQPKLLFVAALAGHHATLARETYGAFLPDYDVHVTDWCDARFVPLSEGRFGFEEYVRYVMEFIDFLGPDTHVVAICQATVPTLTAVAAMAQRDKPSSPGSLTLMAGPLDVRVNPHPALRAAGLTNPEMQRWLTVSEVPTGYPGAGRRVYPGLLQLYAFMGFNLHAHLQKHQQFFLDVVGGHDEAADKHRQFYDEFYAVLDVTEEFYMETLERVFFDQHLARGIMQFEGRTVDCGAIRDLALLTVEGELDDMCPPGMTAVAHDLCSGLDPVSGRRHVEPGVGHYGVFSGSRFREGIAPVIADFIRSS